MELKNKIVDFLGDSITEGTGVSDIENCRYDNVLHKMLGFKEHYNHGVGGSRLAHQTTPSEVPRYDLCFCGRAYYLNKSSDLIVVYGGVNDYIHGDAYFGTLEDTTNSTFCGAIHFLMKLLKELYPSAKIVFMTPAHMYFKGVSDAIPSQREIKKPDAKPLLAYVEAIKAKGKEFGIPVLDLFEKLPIDPNKPEDFEKYTVDGLHFNNEGQLILAQVLRDFLLSI